MFWPLRIYAGGYHADTEFRCYLLSTMCEIIILGIGSMIKIPKSIFVVAMLFLVSILILHFAPQGNVNKLLNQQEYILYKEKVRRILTIHGLVFGATYVIGLSTVWQTIVLSQILMLVILVAGQIKWKCYLKGKERLFEERVRNEITEKC